MNKQEKLSILKDRLQKMESSSKENYGTQRKTRREIRNLEKECLKVMR